MSHDSFDYLIVGGGAAGAILADRLSEDGRRSVCLLEAGPSDWHPYLHIPAGFIKVLFDPAFTWTFSSEPTAWTNGRRIPLPQGRALGGSTSINGLVYNRGQREDFDDWAAWGNTGWSYQEVLPYFQSNERYAAGDDRYRGREGRLPVSDLEWIHPVCEQFMSGAQGMGMPRNPDYNGETQAGVGYFQRSIDGRWRMSTSRTYLSPARGRANLTVITHAQATSIVFDGRRATGVRYVKGNDRHNVREVHARCEVVVACGAINTPKLLQLSGVGPAGQLHDLGVPVVHDGVVRRMDRVVIVDGSLWILDYKRNLYDTQRAAYGRQLAEYRAACEQLFEAMPIMTALITSDGKLELLASGNLADAGDALAAD